MLKNKSRKVIVSIATAALLVGLTFPSLLASYRSWAQATSDEDHTHRRLAKSSGEVVNEVEGHNSGPELEKRGKALTKQPDWGSPYGAVVDYFISLQKWDRENGKPTLPDDAFTTFHSYDLVAHLPPDANASELPVELQGIWCGPWHPSQLACFVPYPTDKEELGGKGLPTQGFKPGKVFFWDSPGARNTLEFFTRFDAEFEIPQFGKGVTPGLGSGFWTYARAPFEVLPYPVAVYEGLPEGHLNILTMRKVPGGHLSWDAGTSDDPALCFCSLFYEGPNVIKRNNFGKLSYRVYRVIDGNGSQTPWYSNFTSWAEGRTLVKTMRDDLFPDMSCTAVKWLREHVGDHHHHEDEENDQLLKK